MLRKVKQLLSNFEAERWENLSNLRLAKKSVAYKKNSSVAVVEPFDVCVVETFFSPMVSI